MQLDKLQQCDKIFQEKVSGIIDKRARLQACLECVRQGDTLVVTKLDRLARSTLHLCQIAEEYVFDDYRRRRAKKTLRTQTAALQLWVQYLVEVVADSDLLVEAEATAYFPQKELDTLRQYTAS